MVLTDDNTGNTDENPEEEKEEELHSAHGAGRGVILYTEYTLHALLFTMPARVLIMSLRPAMEPEHVLVNLLRGPGIDSQPGGPVREAYLSYRPARLYRLAESIPGRHKCLQIRALDKNGRRKVKPSKNHSEICWMLTSIMAE